MAIVDPKTGERFGTSRRLNPIYRVNMQSAYSGARYQRMRDNADNRPYWKYSAVGDRRTRPAHLDLSGMVFRYDDPFWATFYPPNGFNCRCCVIALSEREIKRGNIPVRSGKKALVPVARGRGEITTAYNWNGQKLKMADKGFDYNIGRMNYTPNLDLYPEPLAHQFAKVEMAGEEFKYYYELFEKAYQKAKAEVWGEGKMNEDILHKVQKHLSYHFKFAAGVISKKDRRRLKLPLSTGWLSDESLIKQMNSRIGDKYFAFDSYADLPDVIHQADKIYLSGRSFIFEKSKGEDKVYIAVVSMSCQQRKRAFPEFSTFAG